MPKSRTPLPPLGPYVPVRLGPGRKIHIVFPGSSSLCGWPFYTIHTPAIAVDPAACYQEDVCAKCAKVWDIHETRVDRFLTGKP